MIDKRLQQKQKERRLEVAVNETTVEKNKTGIAKGNLCVFDLPDRHVDVGGAQSICIFDACFLSLTFVRLR